MLQSSISSDNDCGICGEIFGEFKSNLNFLNCIINENVFACFDFTLRALSDRNEIWCVDSFETLNVLFCMKVDFIVCGRALANPW